MIEFASSFGSAIGTRAPNSGLEIISCAPSVSVATTGTPLNIASAILMESTLSFLGLGVQQPNASWGSMLNNAQSFIGEATWLAMFPGVLILLTVLSFNVLGDVLRTAFEPGANRDE